MMKTILFAIALLFFGAAYAAGETERGSTAPGTAQDGSRPQDGAINGGSILPGESAGVPGKAAPADRGSTRCNELSGTLRDQCLLNEQGASTGGTTVPNVGTQKPVPPRTAPPPQNPR